MLVFVVLSLIILIGVIFGRYAYLLWSGSSSEASQEISAPTLTANGNATVFRISKDQSEVRFLIDIIQNGELYMTEVGRTQEIAGDILIDSNNLKTIQMGTIRVNARTLTASNEMHTNVLRGIILKSAQDQYEFSEFESTEILNLPDTVEMSETYNFEVAGNLTIQDTTRAVVFTVSATPISDNRVEGLARAEIDWQKWQLELPPVPGSSKLGELTTLEIEFVAEAVVDEVAR